MKISIVFFYWYWLRAWRFREKYELKKKYEPIFLCSFCWSSWYLLIACLICWCLLFICLCGLLFLFVVTQKTKQMRDKMKLPTVFFFWYWLRVWRLRVKYQVKKKYEPLFFYLYSWCSRYLFLACLICWCILLLCLCGLLYLVSYHYLLITYVLSISLFVSSLLLFLFLL